MITNLQTNWVKSLKPNLPAIQWKTPPKFLTQIKPDGKLIPFETEIHLPNFQFGGSSRSKPSGGSRSNNFHRPRSFPLPPQGFEPELEDVWELWGSCWLWVQSFKRRTPGKKRLMEDQRWCAFRNRWFSGSMLLLGEAISWLEEHC